MAGDTLTIAIAALAFIAGTIGAWLVYTDLRDSKRRFEARQKPYGDVIAVPAGYSATPAGKGLGGEAKPGEASAADTHTDVRTRHSGSVTR